MIIPQKVISWRPEANSGQCHRLRPCSASSTPELGGRCRPTEQPCIAAPYQGPPFRCSIGAGARARSGHAHIRNSRGADVQPSRSSGRLTPRAERHPRSASTKTDTKLETAAKLKNHEDLDSRFDLRDASSAVH